MKSREIRLKRNPVGVPEESDFELVEVEAPEPAEGEVLVRNRYMSVDPYMRTRIAAVQSYADNWKPGEPMRGRCVGEVVESRSSDFSRGDLVTGERGWRDYFVERDEVLRRIDPQVASPSAYLGVLGMPGMTAFVGLMKLARPEPGETVFVSGAAGAVGSLVCQLARDADCRVVASAGSRRKVEWLTTTAGVDAAFNYKEVDDLSAELARQAPEGVHIYFDNVGADHLEAALANMVLHGHIISCGMIAVYNATDLPPAPRNLFNIVGRRLRIQGFVVRDHQEHYDEFIATVGAAVREGRIAYEETIVDGLENAPRAFVDLFSGTNLGKMVVKIG